MTTISSLVDDAAREQAKVYADRLKLLAADITRQQVLRLEWTRWRVQTGRVVGHAGLGRET